MHVCFDEDLGITEATVYSELDSSDVSAALAVYSAELRAGGVATSRLTLRLVDAVAYNSCSRTRSNGIDNDAVLRGIMDDSTTRTLGVTFKFEVLGNALWVHAVRAALMTWCWMLMIL